MNSTPRRRGRRRTQPGRQRASRVVDLVQDEITITQRRVSNCIDLTEEQEASESFVDLTNVIDSPVIALGDTDNTDTRNERRRLNTQHRSITSISSSDSEDNSNDLPPSGLPVNTPVASSSNAVSVSPTEPFSPTERIVSCPICLDSDRKIRSSGRQMMSTTCGHIFCDICIRSAVQAQHKCPNCRRKLSLKMIHPIFLW